MPLFMGKGSRKCSETAAQRARDMWIARLASDNLLLGEEGASAPTMGDVDSLIEWNTSSDTRHGHPKRLSNDAPVSQQLKRQHIRAWKKSINDCRTTLKRVKLWPCMYCLHYIDYKSRPINSRFFCRRSECL
ncbi:hypothetical protein G6011_02962 [Alternaria panax]|uniref:Uncharacterized protein n=1 Tax=Alternaria panax TaxID=48097 RepID=A0AAD4FBZ5_9PLEO|nr:hypothetical protein G6011_02962 [Alternaria panax]